MDESEEASPGHDALDPTMDPTGQVAKRFSLADPDDQDHAREHGEGTYTG